MRTFLAIFSAALMLTSSTAAIAEYRLRLSEIAETGAEIGRAAWTCSDAEMEANRCRRDTHLTIDGQPQPVEVLFRDNSGIVRLSLISNGIALAVHRSRNLLLKENGGPTAGSFEVWATQQKDDTNTLNDLVYRPAYQILTTIGLVVERTTRPQ
jgi:hypothetical protein